MRLIEIQTFLVFFFASLPPHSAVEAHFSSQVLYSVITGPSDLFLLIYVAARSPPPRPPHLTPTPPFRHHLPRIHILGAAVGTGTHHARELRGINLIHERAVDAAEIERPRQTLLVVAAVQLQIEEKVCDGGQILHIRDDHVRATPVDALATLHQRLRLLLAPVVRDVRTADVPDDQTNLGIRRGSHAGDGILDGDAIFNRALLRRRGFEVDVRRRLVLRRVEIAEAGVDLLFGEKVR